MCAIMELSYNFTFYYLNWRTKMHCSLCKKPILNYHPALNNIKIDESTAADICSECIDKFLKWQQSIFAKLFPTKAAKKRYGKS